ncbi:MAG: hypothetical protein JWL90_1186 [Chthoniobacteraceae bacterium]|nr:hypothetical protein [Chthoniobacteraceae bacterium]
MNSRILIGIALFSALSATSQLFADSLVTTGSVTAVVKERGALTVLSDQTHAPIQYTGMNKAVVQFGSGKPATLTDLSVGQSVTIEYVVIDQLPVVAKLIVPDPAAPAVTAVLPVAAPGLNAAEQRAATSRAALDNDITTQPGNKARIDRDITTQPGRADLQAPDATKRVVR